MTNTSQLVFHSSGLLCRGRASPSILAERSAVCHLSLEGRDETSVKESLAPGSQSQLLPNIWRLDSFLWVYNRLHQWWGTVWRSVLHQGVKKHCFPRGARTSEPWSVKIGWKILGTFPLTPGQCSWRSFVDVQGRQTGPSWVSYPVKMKTFINILFFDKRKPQTLNNPQFSWLLTQLFSLCPQEGLLTLKASETLR